MPFPKPHCEGRLGLHRVCECSFTVNPQQALTGMAHSAPALGGTETQISLSPKFATIILAGFLDSVKQGKNAGLDLPLTGEH